MAMLDGLLLTQVSPPMQVSVAGQSLPTLHAVVVVTEQVPCGQSVFTLQAVAFVVEQTRPLDTISYQVSTS
jgi:hypothetical protein